MNSEIIYDAITDIDEKYIIEAKQHRFSKPRKTPTRWYAIAAALVLVLGIGGYMLFYNNSPSRPGGVSGNSNTGSSTPDSGTSPSGGTTAETIPSPAQPSAEIPPQIGFYFDYTTLAELIASLEQSDQYIEDKIFEIQESFSAHPFGYYINLLFSPNSDKRADLELIHQLLQKPLFPVNESAELIDIGLQYTLFDSPSWQVSLRYEDDEVVYSFAVSDSESESTIRYFEMNEYWDLELLRSEDDIRIYLQTPDDPDWVAYNHDVPESALVFGMDVRGLWVTAMVFGVNDIQTAFDGILSFEFGALWE